MRGFLSSFLRLLLNHSLSNLIGFFLWLLWRYSFLKMRFNVTLFVMAFVGMMLIATLALHHRSLITIHEQLSKIEKLENELRIANQELETCRNIINKPTETTAHQTPYESYQEDEDNYPSSSASPLASSPSSSSPPVSICSPFPQPLSPPPSVSPPVSPSSEPTPCPLCLPCPSPPSSSSSTSSSSTSTSTSIISSETQPKSTTQSLPCSSDLSKKSYGLSVDPWRLPRDKGGVHPVIRSFRQGHLDWHSLLEPLETINMPKNPFKFISQQREAEILNILMNRGWERSFFERDFGPLSDLALCGYLPEECMVHSRRIDCIRDSFCAWSPSSELCISQNSTVLATPSGRSLEPLETFWTPRYFWKDFGHNSFKEWDKERVMRVVVAPPPPPNPKAKAPPPPPFPGYNPVVKKLVEQIGTKDCTYLISEPYYQVLEAKNKDLELHLRELLARGALNPRTGYSNHIIREGATSSSSNADWFTLASSNCDRKLNDLPTGTCFVVPTSSSSSSSSSAAAPAALPSSPSSPSSPSVQEDSTSSLPPINLRRFLRTRLDISTPIPRHPKVGIITRKVKRFILNHHELVQAAVEEGFEVNTLPLEDMTLYEQMIAFSSINVLIGIHSPGLTNIRFLPPGSVLVQLLPWKIESTHPNIQALETLARESSADYVVWKNTNFSNTRIHTHLLGKYADDMDANSISQGYGLEEPALWNTFWINQDTYLPVEEFKNLLHQAVAKIQYPAK